MNLLLLALDIQEALLFLPRTVKGRDPVRERHVRPIAAIPDWRKQREMWEHRAGKYPERQQEGRLRFAEPGTPCPSVAHLPSCPRYITPEPAREGGPRSDAYHRPP